MCQALGLTQFRNLGIVLSSGFQNLEGKFAKTLPEKLSFNLSQIAISIAASDMNSRLVISFRVLLIFYRRCFNGILHGVPIAFHFFNVQYT